MVLPIAREMLEALLREELGKLGASSFAVSDGIKRFRLTVDEPNRQCVWGEIYEIVQTLHVFCVDFICPGHGDDEPSWTIYFEPVCAKGRAQGFTERQMRNLVDLFTEPDDVEWLHVVRGGGKRRSQRY